jgi:predicted HicB family RNase H-like nuclease
MMNYKGYMAKVEFDDEAGLFHGQVINMRDVITFQGQSVDELRQAFAESVDDYLDFCAERKEEPERPFSGRFLVRLEPALHRDIAIAASRAGESINTWIGEVLADAVRTPQPSPLAQHNALAPTVAHFVQFQAGLQGIVSAPLPSGDAWAMSSVLRGAVVSLQGTTMPIDALGRLFKSGEGSRDVS